MIIFYNKTTGKIVGNIEGRIHGADHLNMWMGTRDKTDRIVVNWIQGKDGFVPDIQDKIQREVYELLDRDSSVLFDYKVDINSKSLIKKV